MRGNSSPQRQTKNVRLTTPRSVRRHFDGVAAPRTKGTFGERPDEPPHQRCIAIAKESSVVASADRSPFSEPRLYAPTDVRDAIPLTTTETAIRDKPALRSHRPIAAPLAGEVRVEPDPVPTARLDDGSWLYIAGDPTPPLAQSISGHSHLFRKPFRHGGGPL
jgi:hypothetical protein